MRLYMHNKTYSYFSSIQCSNNVYIDVIDDSAINALCYNVMFSGFKYIMILRYCEYIFINQIIAIDNIKQNIFVIDYISSHFKNNEQTEAILEKINSHVYEKILIDM